MISRFSLKETAPRDFKRDPIKKQVLEKGTLSAIIAIFYTRARILFSERRGYLPPRQHRSVFVR
jgi:hypothetical protein